ncbi:transcription factor domain-containing protein [Aspergillus lucknowensis]|uniref:Fungal-specific transcription factor domain-containing protein n=1 Tax=Aspergillus lucknowensis TaxID=176173 RepID=A0ABR4LXP4_9EURO
MSETHNSPRGMEPTTCKSCDHCRTRKVRCIVDPVQSSRCIQCVKRNESCHFTLSKRKLKPKSLVERRSKANPARPPLKPLTETSRQQPSSTIFLDQMLENHSSIGMQRDSSALLRVMTSSSLAFFTEHRIHSLSQRLGNNRLNELVETIETVIRSRILAQGPSSISRITFKRPADIEHVPLDKAKLYIDSYFHQLHPIYPFLDRKEFEDKAFGPHLSEVLNTSCAFSALYHTILALACQYHEGGTFDPGNGRAWKLFQVSLGLVSDILIPREGLLSLQSIFALTSCCLQIDEILVMEAARMAQGLGYHRATGDGDQRYRNTCHRTFWVIYFIEKHMCFQSHKGSIIPDYDIGCPVPEVPESVFEGHNWFMSAIAFGRLLSNTYTTLFSVSAATQSTEAYHRAIEAIETQLERWRMAVPWQFRPVVLEREQSAPQPPDLHFTEPAFKLAVLQTKFCYYGLIIALVRLKMYIGREDPAPSQEKSKRLLMDTARAIVEGSRDIVIAAYTPNFVLAVLPLAALFILFDFVVHNPTHPETRNNLSLLDVAAGHFSLLDYKSGGVFPASLLTEFAHIARQYVKDLGNIRLNGRQRRQQQQQQPLLQEEEEHQQDSLRVDPTPETELNSSRPTNGLGNDTVHDTGFLEGGLVETWDASNDLYYPVLPDFMPGDCPENFMASSLNVHSLFGLAVPDITFD